MTPNKFEFTRRLVGLEADYVSAEPALDGKDRPTVVLSFEERTTKRIIDIVLRPSRVREIISDLEALMN